MDWQARLDSKGYHIMPIKRPILHVRWASETRESLEWNEKKNITDRWLLGDAIELSESEDFASPFRVAVGDAVYLTGQAKGKPAELQLVNEMFEDGREGSKKKGKIWLASTAFWRPERLKIPEGTIDWELDELFVAKRQGEFLMVDNDPAAFVELVRVNATVRATPIPADEKEPHKYFYRLGFDPKTGITEAVAEGAEQEAEAAPAPATAAGDNAAEGATGEAADDTHPDARPAKRAKPNEALKARVAELEGEVKYLKKELVDVLARVRTLEAVGACS